MGAALERGLPLVDTPFAAVARELGVSEAEAIEATRALLSGGLLRHLGAFVDFRPLGFVGYLFGAQVSDDGCEETVAWISSREYITHIYERLSPVNLWFTAILSGDGAAFRLSGGLRERGCPHVALATVRRIKLEPSFAQREGRWATAKRPCSDASSKQEAGSQVVLSPQQRGVLLIAQATFPVESRPFARIGSDLGASEEDVLARLRELASCGVLRRIGASLHHVRSGFTSNSLVAWNLRERPEAEVLEAASQVAGNDWLSHCYLRRTLVDTLEFDWGYNLYTMIHARSDSELREREGILSSTLRGHSFVSMKTKREWKKTPYRIGRA